jgi:hypothetical protein
MPISHFFAEGIGPFKSIHLDLRGPDGHPSVGPHILAGVNGSRKSTILKAIAWCLAESEHGFAEESPNPRVLLIKPDVDDPGEHAMASSRFREVAAEDRARLRNTPLGGTDAMCSSFG